VLGLKKVDCEAMPKWGATYVEQKKRVQLVGGIPTYPSEK
jgi:hypothetical protein